MSKYMSFADDSQILIDILSFSMCQVEIGAKIERLA